jgi:hypothetical protein
MKNPEVYVNFSIPLPDRDRVVDELRRLKRTAFVTPVQAGYVVACHWGPERGQRAHMPTVEDIAALYSVTFNAPIFVVACNSLQFGFWLLEGQKITASYGSTEIEDVEPDDEEEIAIVIADRKQTARRICEVLGRPAAVPSVEDILLHNERFAPAFKQHAALVEALGLATWSLGAGYVGLTEGILPAGLAAGALRRSAEGEPTRATFRTVFESAVAPYGTLGADHRSLLPAWRPINHLAVENELATLWPFESYGPEDAAGTQGVRAQARQAAVEWFAPAAGLAAVDGLWKHLEAHPGVLGKQAAVMEDLSAIGDELAAARRTGVRFRFAVLIM